MKYLVMCEGTNEEKIIEMLLNKSKLIFTRNDLIGRKPYHLRQLNNPAIKSELKMYNKPVIVYRIGDKQTDLLRIPKELKNIVSSNQIFKYCTKPELEILIIINEKMYSEFIKSKMSPKDFIKGKKLNSKLEYDGSLDFFENYYGGKNIENLIKNLKEYKKLKKHNKDELYVYDLLK